MPRQPMFLDLPSYLFKALASSDQVKKSENGDIIDEAILLFRSNAYYRNFELLGPADRTLAYLLLFIGDCLTKLKFNGMDVAEASRTVTNFATNGFVIPGDDAFPLKAMFSAPSSRSEADELREWLGKLRHETAQRLVQTIYGKSQTPSQWWMAFQKRKFMGKSLL